MACLLSMNDDARLKWLVRKKTKVEMVKLRTWRGTLQANGTDNEGRDGIVCVSTSEVNNTGWGWSSCVFFVFIGLIFIVVSQFRWLLLCSKRKWAFAFQCTNALYYILQPRGTEPLDKYTSCRFLEKDEMYVIQRLPVRRCEVLRFDYTNVLTKKIELN